MNQCIGCAWAKGKTGFAFCVNVRLKGLVCNNYCRSDAEAKLDPELIKKVLGDLTFNCPRCGRNRDPGKCWNCELEGDKW